MHLGNLLHCFRLEMKNREIKFKSSVFRNADPSKLGRSLLEGNKDHLLSQARSEIMKQEHQVESLNNCIDFVRTTQNRISVARHGLHQKISKPKYQKLKTMVTRRKDQKHRLRNFDARHGRTETGAVVKN